MNMSSALSIYKERLSSTVKELTLHESKWNAEGWKKAWIGIDQRVLNDAFDQHGLVRSIFSGLGEISTRPCKSAARVEKKMTEQAPGRENFFKVVSDFVAVRVHCEVNEIQGKIDRIREIVLADGQVHVRGSSAERPYGFFMAPDKKYTDITQYVYVFLERVGYPIEFQIGHKFASHTFAIDSALRDSKECGKVDLWCKNFYSDVKKHILDKSNGENPGSKEAIQAKAEDIHQGKVPEELQEILNKL
jgi:hypothetical protein